MWRFTASLGSAHGSRLSRCMLERKPGLSLPTTVLFHAVGANGVVSLLFAVLPETGQFSVGLIPSYSRAKPCSPVPSNGRPVQVAKGSLVSDPLRPSPPGFSYSLVHPRLAVCTALLQR